MRRVPAGSREDESGVAIRDRDAVGLHLHRHPAERLAPERGHQHRPAHPAQVARSGVLAIRFRFVSPERSTGSRASASDVPRPSTTRRRISGLRRFSETLHNLAERPPVRSAWKTATPEARAMRAPRRGSSAARSRTPPCRGPGNPCPWPSAARATPASPAPCRWKGRGNCGWRRRAVAWVARVVSTGHRAETVPGEAKSWRVRKDRSIVW